MSKEISTNRFAWKRTNNNFCPGWHNCSRTSLTSLRSIITHNNEVQMPMCYPGHNRLSIQTKGLCLGKVTCLPFNPCPRLSFLFPGESPARWICYALISPFCDVIPFPSFYCLVWTFGRYLLEVVPLIKLSQFIPGLEVSRSRGGDNFICGIFLPTDLDWVVGLKRGYEDLEILGDNFEQFFLQYRES